MSDGARQRGTLFNPRVVLAMIVFGAAAFLATLYFIGSGQTGGRINDGGAHAAGKGLTGYAALAAYLEAEDHEVVLSRSQARFDDYALIVLTPGHEADAEDIDAILDLRGAIGPTLVIVPKWRTAALPSFPGSEAEEGWVRLGDPAPAGWVARLDDGRDFATRFVQAAKASDRRWSGYGTTGRLPDPRFQVADTNALTPLVRDVTGATMAGLVPENRSGGDYPVAFLVEPDLVNNYGFADRAGARLAAALIDDLSNDGELPVVFDLTLNGLGTQQNLLTLAFRPPFLAATLCLLLALLVIGWRALSRFGPPIAQSPEIPFGKTQLVVNGAGFIQRAKRFHLLGSPYADIIERRIARTLGLRPADTNVEAIEQALTRARADAPSYSASIARLRSARRGQDILGAASALASIERIIAK